MAAYHTEFIDLLLSSGALTFGNFVTKSGRETPYFVNFGTFNDGTQIERLGELYAEHILATFGEGLTTVFGPAYKGIPLAVATATALSKRSGRPVHFSFNRKEQKGHGDKGLIVGKQLEPGDRIVIVEDVITAGTTFREAIPLLRSFPDVTILGAVLAVDRCERGEGEASAVQEVRSQYSLPVEPLVTIRDIVRHVKERGAVTPEMEARIEAYLGRYGA